MDSPLSEKLKNVKWGEFRVEDVLEWQPQIEIDPLKLKELTVENTEEYPFYGQATINNGIISYESLTENVLNNKTGLPTILVHSNNQNVVYVETPFYLKDGHGATSVLQSGKLNKTNALFLMAAISSVITKTFSYNCKATKIALKNSIIQLPLKENTLVFSNPCDNIKNIDFDFMESFIR
ncbi:MAG: restriction endonuclease subunit S, partial [Treponema sp.]|nr:restriction endonuclease subunit S [Candidatus Treponema equifaecale]